MELTTKQKAAFGIGAVGKDMVYALSASYVMYYYQDVLGLPATFVGLILMIARVFDAFNDPFMGVLVAKTRTRWGRFRPWILSGTVLNAVVLYALFAAPVLEGADMMVYFSVIYILWGVTYTMMDIPYWSMIPAVTRTPADRENLSVVGRTCAGVGSALIAMFTMLLVGALGGDSERTGFRWVALLVAVIFVVTEAICCASVKETGNAEIKTATVGEMFKALFSNSVDYGQLKTGRREESVIFSMQTFVVKAASGVAVFLTGIGLDLIGLAGNAEETGPVAAQSAGTLLGLRLMMTVLPMAVLAAALVLFRRRFTLTDDRAAEISAALHREETQNG